MTAHAEIIPSIVDRIKRSLVGLKMRRAIEILDATVRRIERGEMNALEAIDALLTEELTLRENRRVKMALVMARLSAIKTLAGFDFSFQPSLDRNRIMALAELQFIEFIDRAEVLHLIGPPGTGKRPDAASTSAPSPISSAPSPRPNARELCARKSGSSAASLCSSSTRSATSQSSRAAAISSSSSSTPVTKRGP